MRSTWVLAGRSQREALFDVAVKTAFLNIEPERCLEPANSSLPYPGILPSRPGATALHD